MNTFFTPPDNVPRLCLIRHGETEWNAARRIQGHTDTALNAKGLRQAEALAARFAALAQQHLATRFSAIHSSDLLRARDTAAPIAAALGCPLNLLPQLRERHYGVLEGLTYDEIQEQFPDAHTALAQRLPEYLPSGGESLAQAFARVSALLAGLCLDHPGGILIIVTHGGILDLVNRFVRQRPLNAPRDFPVPNAALNWLRRETDPLSGDCSWKIEHWAEIGHLPKSARAHRKATYPFSS
ncbi:MAG: histidine phosphatase family protein [Betaproteobacteria bacterium]|nr:histidine phosphatase family protein [Betaproteobacteria bacterium]